MGMEGWGWEHRDESFHPYTQSLCSHPHAPVPMILTLHPCPHASIPTLPSPHFHSKPCPAYRPFTMLPS